MVHKTKLKDNTLRNQVFPSLNQKINVGLPKNSIISIIYIHSGLICSGKITQKSKFWAKSWKIGRILDRQKRSHLNDDSENHKNIHGYPWIFLWFSESSFRWLLFCLSKILPIFQDLAQNLLFWVILPEHISPEWIYIILMIEFFGRPTFIFWFNDGNTWFLNVLSFNLVLWTNEKIFSHVMRMY